MPKISIKTHPKSKKVAVLKKGASHYEVWVREAPEKGKANQAVIKVIAPLDYAIFQDHGYKGLYGGLGAKDIHHSKRLKKGQGILDHMGSTELAANLFRTTQTEEKIKREKIKGKDKANFTHFEVGKKVRQTIKELGGKIPEELPISDNIKKIKKLLKLRKTKLDVVGLELSDMAKGKISTPQIDA